MSHGLREILHKYLGGNWHAEIAPGRLDQHDAEDFSARAQIHAPLRAATAFYADMSTPRAQLLTEKLAALGIHASLSPQEGQTRVTLPAIEAAQCKNILPHDHIKHDTIADQLAATFPREK